MTFPRHPRDRGSLSIAYRTYQAVHNGLWDRLLELRPHMWMYALTCAAIFCVCLSVGDDLSSEFTSDSCITIRKSQHGRDMRFALTLRNRVRSQTMTSLCHACRVRNSMTAEQSEGGNTCRPDRVRRVCSPLSPERPFCCRISLNTSAVRYERSISTCERRYGQVSVSYQHSEESAFDPQNQNSQTFHQKQLSTV